MQLHLGRESNGNSDLRNFCSMSKTIAQLCGIGVPQPLCAALLQYQTALDSGLSDAGCRIVFQDHFLEPSSPLHAHVDDMVWVVRGFRGSQLQTFVSLMRRGSQEAQSLLEEATREDGDCFSPAQQSTDFLGAAQETSASEVGSTTPARQTSSEFPMEEASSSQKLFRMLSETIQSPIGKRKRPVPLWPETLALNLVVQWKFTLTVAVTRMLETSPGKSEMVAIRREVHRVYGQPTRTVFSSDKEGRGSEGDQLDYPNIYFNVENFDQDAFRDMQLCAGYNFAVLLTAGDGHTDSNATLFRGVLSYDTIMGRVLKKSKENGYVPTESRKEFIPLLGPERKGKAEIAVSVSDVELQASASQDSVPTTTRNSGNFFTNLLRRRASGKSDTELDPSALRGDEILRCCLTFVSIPIQHVCQTIMSPERASARQWMFVPESREQLDALLERSELRTPVAASPISNVSSGEKSSPDTSFFASLKKKLTS